VTTTVEYTCGASGTGDCFLSERVSPNAATELISNHDEGTTIQVECQVVGQAVSSSVLDRSSRIWARTTGGGYVAAIFLSGIDKYHVTTPCR
jgi:serine/threonine-protein kinase